MNKKHVSKVGKCISMACLLLACVVVQSCRDEYFYDDREPERLKTSIYSYLEEQGNFTLFKRVIDDLKYAEVLNKTGSKTLFVADDAAFMKGIKEAWQFDSYEDLTTEHKRIILNSAMLDNAYLLEMLSKMQSTGTHAEPVPGQCLRRETSASVVDSVPLFFYKDLPGNNPDWNIFKGGNVRLALDATPTLMLHLIGDFLHQEAIKESDVELILRKPTVSKNDIYVYDKKVIEEKSDVPCKNGYVHQLDGLLIPPSNMAEELRQNALLAFDEKGAVNEEALDSTTMIFSYMLDRYAVPVPIDEGSDFAETYYFRYPNRLGEELYQKKYYARGKLSSYTDAKGNPHVAVGQLLFDPGWNSYNGENVAKERDMAAILAPSDRAFIAYFSDEVIGGKSLIDRYGANVEDRFDITKGLLEAIDSIPLDILEDLMNNHMQVSFVSSVPSKFRNVVDDARDELGIVPEHVVKPILANNGVVYVTDRVYRPARFASVIEPVMLDDSLFVFNTMIEKEGYDSYLLSMKNKFSLIVTADKDMRYYDPYTERKTGARTIYEFRRVNTTDQETGTVTSSVKAKALSQAWNAKDKTYGAITRPKDDYNGSLSPLYKEILEYNIVIGDMNSEKDCNEGRKYYMSKGYGSVKVERGADGKGKVTKIAGGRELQHNTMLPLALEREPKENGSTFQLAGALMQPPTQTVREVLRDTTFTQRCFNRFYNDLCVPNNKVITDLYNADIFDKGENAKNPKPKTQNDFEKQYRVFDKATDLVSVFDTYHYTVYVPCEAAMENAYSQGLKTWAELYDSCLVIDELKKAGKLDEAKKRIKQVKAEADLIAKFVRYHFQDNSVFVDVPPHSLATNRGNGEFDYDYQVEYSTAALNESTNRFSKVVVQTDMASNTIAVRGDFGEPDDEALDNCKHVCRVINTDPGMENKQYNIMTRDITFSDSSISTSSYAVVHLIDNFLVYGGQGGIYDADKKQFIKYIME